jgi:acetoin utilization deacetylase AcuC-like enzyme
MPTFATSLAPETLLTADSVAADQFIGQSLPYAASVRAGLVEALRGYPILPYRLADFALFADVHTSTYLDQITQLAAGQRPEPYPQLSMECSGLWHALPGYCAGLGGMLAAIDAMQTGNLDRAFCFSLGGHHAYPARGHG